MAENSQSTRTNQTAQAAGSGIRALKNKIEPQLIKQREGWRDRNGNTHYVEYVEWHTVADILDNETPGWTHTVKSMQEVGEIFCVIAAITIDGITREGIGTGAAGTELGIKKAEHDALKRAAVKFGVGRELYKKESDEIERKGSIPYSVNTQPINPIARSQSDLITAKQLGMIRALAREKGANDVEECGKIFDGANLDEISKRAALWLIEHLKELPEAANEPTEVKIGIPNNPPVQSKQPNPQNVREMPQRQTAPSTPTRQNTAAQMRHQILDKFNEVKQNADPSLAAYDAEQDLAKKRDIFTGISNYIIQIKREQLKQALDASHLDANEYEGELGRFGMNDGLRRGSTEQIERMWHEYRAANRL